MGWVHDRKKISNQLIRAGNKSGNGNLPQSALSPMIAKKLPSAVAFLGQSILIPTMDRHSRSRARVGCSARTAGGHATALLSPAIKSRRRILDSPHCLRGNLPRSRFRGNRSLGWPLIRVGPGNFTRSPHRTVREPLDSYGSYHRMKVAAFH
jgi:hypothetical protein